MISAGMADGWLSLFGSQSKKKQPSKSNHKFHTTAPLTMAALLPTILSDEEDENVISTKKSGKKKAKTHKAQIESDDEQSKASSGDEMDGDFEFGGMLVSECEECFVDLLLRLYSSKTACDLCI